MNESDDPKHSINRRDALKGGQQPDFEVGRRPKPSSREISSNVGKKEYACIDLNEEHGAIPLDLNQPLEDISLYGQFDRVTDFGCNEHAFNIAEAYRTMHRLYKKKGLLVIFQAI